MPKFLIQGTKRYHIFEQEIEATDLREANALASRMGLDIESVSVHEIRPVNERTNFSRESEDREL